MPNGPESNGPSEEDLKIRTEAGEPESRSQDVERARGLALVTKEAEEELVRSEKSLKELYDEEYEYVTQNSVDGKFNQEARTGLLEIWTKMKERQEWIEFIKGQIEFPSRYL